MYPTKKQKSRLGISSEASVHLAFPLFNKKVFSMNKWTSRTKDWKAVLKTQQHSKANIYVKLKDFDHTEKKQQYYAYKTISVYTKIFLIIHVRYEKHCDQLSQLTRWAEPALTSINLKRWTLTIKDCETARRKFLRIKTYIHAVDKSTLPT